jgi:hypothetical protein
MYTHTNTHINYDVPIKRLSQVVNNVMLVRDGSIEIQAQGDIFGGVKKRNHWRCRPKGEGM